MKTLLSDLALGQTIIRGDFAPGIPGVSDRLLYAFNSPVRIYKTDVHFNPITFRDRMLGNYFLDYEVYINTGPQEILLVAGYYTANGPQPIHGGITFGFHEMTDWYYQIDRMNQLRMRITMNELAAPPQNQFDNNSGGVPGVPSGSYLETWVMVYFSHEDRAV